MTGEMWSSTCRRARTPMLLIVSGAEDPSHLLVLTGVG
jgi:hypothetical protein